MNTPTVKLTEEQIEAKATELTEREKVKITPLVFIQDDEQIVGYIREPNRLVKMRAVDKLAESLTLAGEMILLSCLIAGESDKRILSESEEHTNIYIGACLSVTALINVSANQYKKK